MKKKYPDFIIGGPQRTGSTWLYSVLRHHPQIYLPFTKEVHFFDRNYEKGASWYESFYSTSNNQYKLFGDITPNYIHIIPEVPDRIKELMPNCKVIFVLREPVSWLWSFYKKRNRTFMDEKGMVFSKFIENENMLVMAKYADKIKYYKDIFGDNMLVLFYEDMQDDKNRFLRKIYNFLGISDFIFDGIEKKVNYSFTPRFPIIHKILVDISRFLRNQHIKPLTILLNYARNGINNGLYAKKFEEKEVLTDEIKQELRKYYREDVENLSNILNKDLMKFWSY
jgi:hypothetical protein